MDAVSMWPVLRQSRASRSQHWPPSSLRPLSDASCLRRARIGSCGGEETIPHGPTRSNRGDKAGASLKMCARRDVETAHCRRRRIESVSSIVFVRRRSPFHRRSPPSHLRREGDLRAGEALLPVELLHSHPQPVGPGRPAAAAAVDEAGYRAHGLVDFLWPLTPTTEVNSSPRQPNLIEPTIRILKASNQQARREIRGGAAEHKHPVIISGAHLCLLCAPPPLCPLYT